MKILLTGGHLTPALSFIDWVQAHEKTHTLVFVGREFSQDVLQQKAVERYEVEKRGVPFISFQAVRLGSQFARHFFKNIARFFASVREAQDLLRRHQPTVVLSFGGYVAVPIVCAAKLLHLPVVTHEQTFTIGFANRVIGFLADAIAVSFTQVRPWLLAGKTVVTGNPLRAGVFQTRHSRPDWLPKKMTKPIILVMGGNQGSQALSTLIQQSLPELVKEWTVVHQCGRPTTQHQWLEILQRHKNRLPLPLQQAYHIREWIDGNDLFWLYRQAFCAISRSGANSTQEFAAALVPSILVPLPAARHNEQQKNAQWLADAGGAVLLDQAVLTPATLLRSLENLKTVRSAMRDNLAALKIPADAAQRLFSVVEAVASS